MDEDMLWLMLGILILIIIIVAVILGINKMPVIDLGEKFKEIKFPLNRG